MKNKITSSQFIRRVTLLIISSIIIIFSGYLYFVQSKALEDNIKYKSEVLSDIIFESLYSTMKNGGSKAEIDTLIFDIESKVPNSKIRLNKILSDDSHKAVRRAFETKKESIAIHDTHIDYAQPIFYEKSCIKCHHNSTPGDLAAVIEIESEISDISIPLGSLSLLIAVLIALIVLVGFLIWYFAIKNYVFNPITNLIYQIGKVSTHKDLHNNINIDSSIQEIQQIESAFNKQNKVLLNLYQDVENSEKILNSIINTNDDLLFYKDHEFNYIGCNEAFLKFVGKTKDEMIGHNDFELFNEDMALLFREMDTKMLEKKEISSNYEWVTYPNGDKVYLLTKKMPFEYEENQIGILGVSRDITELHLSQEKIKSLSYIDELTKLHNRKSYNERINELLSSYKRYKKPFSILMYDIDNFKHINDTYGHQDGDEVLVKMSALVKSNIRTNDFLFRVGGEEFIVLFSETKLEDSKTVSEKIRKKIEEEMIKLNYGKITISAGLCEVTDDDTKDTLYKRVDELLYNAKRSGKNKVVS